MWGADSFLALAVVPNAAVGQTRGLGLSKYAGMIADSHDVGWHECLMGILLRAHSRKVFVEYLVNEHLLR